MTIAAMRLTLAPWLAAVFCAILSLLTVVSNLWLSVANQSDVGGWAIPFLCFLPMCFYFAGAGIFHMQAEIRELKKQVSELQGKQTA
jgi:hypothetical protein